MESKVELLLCLLDHNLLGRENCFSLVRDRVSIKGRLKYIRVVIRVVLSLDAAELGRTSSKV